MDDKMREYRRICNQIEELTLRKELLEKEFGENVNGTDCTVHLNKNNGRYVVNVYYPPDKAQVYVTSSVFEEYARKVYEECLDKCFSEILVIKEKYRKNVTFSRYGY